MIRSRTRFLGAVALAVVAAVALGSVSPSEAAPAAGRRPAASDSQPAVEIVVDINKATEADLVTVPGIGKSLAQRIVEFRQKNGPFNAVDDLLKIQGIGEKSLEKMRPYLTCSKPSKS
jgi:comEA protein